jgi:hypothetical protein
MVHLKRSQEASPGTITRLLLMDKMYIFRIL